MWFSKLSLSKKLLGEDEPWHRKVHYDWIKQGVSLLIHEIFKGFFLHPSSLIKHGDFSNRLQGLPNISTQVAHNAGFTGHVVV